MTPNITEKMVPILADIAAGVNTNNLLASKYAIKPSVIGATISRLRKQNIVLSERVRTPGSVTEHLVYTVNDTEYTVSNHVRFNQYTTKKKRKYEEPLYECLDDFLYTYPAPKYAVRK